MVTRSRAGRRRARHAAAVPRLLVSAILMTVAPPAPLTAVAALALGGVVVVPEDGGVVGAVAGDRRARRDRRIAPVVAIGPTVGRDRSDRNRTDETEVEG